MVISDLEPKKVFEFFALLSSVPHGSGNTKAISDICVRFAVERGLEYHRDELNNVIIIKEATAGYESGEPIILQGHLDMVCAKEPDDPRDMSKVPVEIAVDGDWVHAVGTSLGGDNIIAVAMALAVLDSSELCHPRIEAVFTTDEETGMDGARGLDASPLKGRRMLNLDSEEEGVLTCGCAGGARVDCTIGVTRESAGNEYDGYHIKIGGLRGGHSGCDIDKGHANANKLMTRFLYSCIERLDIRLARFEGGKFDNVITPEAEAEVVVPVSEAAAFEAFAKAYGAIFKNEYSASDDGVFITVEKREALSPLTREDTSRVLLALLLIPQGVEEMSMDIKGLVQTSLNLGVLRLEESELRCSLSVRSSILTQKEMLIQRIRAAVECVGGQISVRSAYPGWQFAKVSPIRDIVADVFAEVYGKPAGITATHGGLECGLFIEKLPGLDAVSFGPDLRDIHSVRERMSVSSVQRMWVALCKILEKCK